MPESSPERSDPKYLDWLKADHAENLAWFGAQLPIASLWCGAAALVGLILLEVILRAPKFVDRVVGTLIVAAVSWFPLYSPQAKELWAFVYEWTPTQLGFAFIFCAAFLEACLALCRNRAIGILRRLTA